MNKYKSNNAIDGTISQDMEGGSCSWTQANAPYRFQWHLDLGNLYQIENVTVFGPDCEYIQYHLQVQHQWGAVGVYLNAAQWIDGRVGQANLPPFRNLVISFT